MGDIRIKDKMWGFFIIQMTFNGMGLDELP